MKLKHLFFALFVIFGLQQSSAQITKFMTSSYSVSEKTPSGKCWKWSQPEKVGIVISLDEKKNRIIVYSQEVQVYTIVKYEDIVENDEDIISALLSPEPCLLEGSRGTGKSFLMKVAELRIEENFHKFLPVFVSFNISSLINTPNVQLFLV